MQSPIGKFPPLPRSDFSPEESLKRASAFLKTIDDSTDVFDFRVITKAGKATNYRGKLSEFVEDFKTLNDCGAGIYVMINESDGKGRKKENIIRVRALMMDFDDPAANNALAISNMPLPPSVYVVTSFGKFHAYWVINNCPLDRFQSLQEKLSSKYQTDPSIKDLPRLMRLPGYNHTKTDFYYPCYALGNIGTKYSLEEFEFAFGLLAPIGLSGDNLSTVSSVSSDSEVNRKRSAEKRAEWISNIIKGDFLHNSTRDLVASNMSRFEMSAKEATDDVQQLLLKSNRQRDEKFSMRYDDVRKIAESYAQKFKEESIHEEWPDVIKIEATLKPVQKLEYNSLPTIFANYTRDVSERMQCPPDFTAISLLVTLSSLVGRKVGIRPKQKDDWLVTPNLWGMIIGRPSLMKTPSLKGPLDILRTFEIEAKEDFEQKLKEFEIDREISEMKQKHNKTEAKDFVKNNDMERAKSLMSKEVVATEPPTRKRYIVNDATVEKLGELLKENTNGLCIFRDELSGFLNSLDRDESSNDRSFYLEAWDGGGYYTYDRIGRGTVDIDPATVSILGGIQPSKIKSYIYGAINGTNSDDGLIQRFQLAVYPDINKNFKLIDKYPNTKAKIPIVEKFKNINNWQPYVMEKNSFGKDEPFFLRFEPKAQLIFNRWFENNERVCRDNQHPALESHFAKYRSLLPSLALLIELVDSSDLHSIQSISTSSTNKAVKLVEYLRTHALRIYGMSEKPEIEGANLIISRLDKLKDPFTAREIHRKGWVGLTDKKVVEKVLELLEEHNYCRKKVIYPASGGRPSAEYYLNPNI
jgi:Protein of unknown function (DUF3987)/RepB DNA-primase N-terminal domain